VLRPNIHCKILSTRLSLSVNDRHVANASLEAKVWLGAPVSLSHGVQSEYSDRVWLSATDHSEDPNSVHSTWDFVPLSIGYKIEIVVLPDGESDSPSEIRRTSESPKNLFSDIEQARLLLAAVRFAIQNDQQ
jgi:hypothetical protein